MENNNSDVSTRDFSQQNFEPQQGAINFDQIGVVEWNSSTKALADFLTALGVEEPASVARSLVQEFGTLSDVLTATDWALRRVVGRRLTSLIGASHALMKAMLEEKVVDGPVIRRSQNLVDLLQTEIGFLNHERLLALFVDSRNRLMRIQRVADGSFGETAINVREIIGCALSIGAAGFVLVHNHPSGIPRPSATDLQMTERLKSLADQLDLTLLDHLIVARGQLASIQEYWQEARFAGETE